MLSCTRPRTPGHILPDKIVCAWVLGAASSGNRDSMFQHMARDRGLIDNFGELLELLLFCQRRKTARFAADGPSGNGQFFRSRGVIHMDAQHETIELSLRKWVGPFLLDWVLRRHYDERRIQVIGFAIDCDRSEERRVGKEG